MHRSKCGQPDWGLGRDRPPSPATPMYRRHRRHRTIRLQKRPFIITERRLIPGRRRIESLEYPPSLFGRINCKFLAINYSNLRTCGRVLCNPSDSLSRRLKNPFVVFDSLLRSTRWNSLILSLHMSCCDSS